MTTCIGQTNFDFFESLSFEKSSADHQGIDLPPVRSHHVGATDIKRALGDEARQENDFVSLPELSEPEVCRHFTRLSRWNYSIDTNSYPLGSCTMKYNPKINEWAARLQGFSQLHPYMPEERLQGALSIMWDLQQMLAQIGGFAEISLQPAAGAHGEFAGVMMMMSALEKRNEKRTKMLVPQSAHGTNPATAAFFGLEIVPLQVSEDGTTSLSEVKAKMSEDCVGIMITNPNTLGIFEKDLLAISHIVHDQGGYVYGDGANLNALMGIVKPGELGIDLMHFNLHKTFTTPHGGGGPGCGAIGACASLAPFLPAPLAARHSDGTYYFDDNRPDSIGKIRSFHGNFGLMVRAFTYIREMGAAGLKRASELAVLNANYIRARLKDHYHIPFTTDCLHEVVVSDKYQKQSGVSTLDIAKRLIDYGIHPPTIYFPLVVSGAMMIEPTETDSKRDLDAICDAFVAVAREAKETPEFVKAAPHNTSLRRLDEAFAARYPVLTWKDGMPTEGQAFREFAQQKRST